IVDQYVELAEGFLRRLEGFAAALRGGNVGGDGDHLGRTRSRNLSPGFLQRRPVAGNDGHIGPGAGKVLGNRPPNAAAATGDKGVASVHAHLHGYPPGRWKWMGGWEISPDCSIAGSNSHSQKVLPGRAAFGAIRCPYPQGAQSPCRRAGPLASPSK